MAQQKYRPPAGSVVLDPDDLSDEPVTVTADDLSDGPARGPLPTVTRGMFADFGDAVLDALAGAAKGVGRSVIGAGQVARAVVPGVAAAGDAWAPKGMTGAQALAEVKGATDPTNTAQSVGQAIEQLLEFVGPGLLGKGATSLAGRMAVEGATNAGVSAVQGGDALSGGLAGAAMPGIGKVAGKVGKAAGRKAVSLVRSAVKPTVTQLKQMAGASQTGINAQADKLARFILDNKLAKPEQAEAIIQATEQELQALLAKGNAVTDAPQRAMRYLNALERSAAKQGLPAQDVATIRAAAVELMDTSKLSTAAKRTVMKPSPSGLVDASGKPVQVPVEETTRVLRGDVKADEALDIARSTNQWETRKSYGEMKGASKEASKAVERGARDAVKKAVPAAAPVLRRQGQAIEAKKALDRMATRTGSRDEISLPGLVGANASAVLGVAAHWLRNNQMRAGRMARALELAIARKDVQAVSDIMGRLGVAGFAEPKAATSGR